MSQNNPPSNPYAKAAKHYDTHATTTTGDPRELEARVLLKAAKQFQELQRKWDNGITIEELDTAITFNRQVWMIFVDTAVENTGANHTVELRTNIANLGAFIFKHSIDMLANPKKEKLDILIEINREIAAGLMQQLPGSGTGTPPAPTEGGGTSQTA